MANDSSISKFLDDVLPRHMPLEPPSFHITLTFAQSLDAKIAGREGKQLILSCNESMFMTHRLRSRHDAILVGINTALNDDPQLNTRLLLPEDGGRDIPLPIILDANLRFRLDSKLMNNFNLGKGRQPTVFTSAELSRIDSDFKERRKKLERAGVKVFPIPSDNGKLNLSSLVSELQNTGVRSLMVEGGASVISSFLQSGLVNSLIITVCPTIVGNEGTTYDVKGRVPELTFLCSQPVGKDTVMAFALRSYSPRQ